MQGLLAKAFRSSLKPLPVLLGLWMGAVLSGFPSTALASGVALSFPDIPAEAAAEEELSLSLAYVKAATESEQRLVFLLEMRRLQDDAVLAQAVQDNSGSGYAIPSGTVSFSLSVPAVEGPIYFAAQAVPWSLNRSVTAWYKTYPTDGTHRYFWTGSSYGVTQDVYYLGELIAPTDASHTTYCCGLTFETCVLAYEDYNTSHGHSTIGTMNVDDMRSFRRIWYGVTDAEKLCARAVTDYQLGEEINNFEEMQEGDFVQFWRRSGSGHSVIFVDWVRNATQEITGFDYWSSQSSTNGIGYNTEFFGDSSGVNRERFWAARLRKPRDAADAEWALGQADTREQPTVLRSGTPAWRFY